MKKILIILLMIVMTLTMALMCYAQDETYAKESITLFSRLEEFWLTHKTEIITIVADVGSLLSLAILTLRNFKKSGKKLDISAAQTNAVYNSQKELDKSNKLVESAVSKLDTAESLIKDYTEQSKMNLEQMVKICLNTQEMLITVCSRSNNIPSQVKDLIDVKYIESVKLSSGEEDKHEQKNVG